MFPSMPKGEIVENIIVWLMSKKFTNDKGITNRYGSGMSSTMTK